MYRGLDNITNKHPVDERENIPHHLLGHVGWDEEYSVQQFEKEALDKIEEIHSRGKLPILVGGTHYYNQAVMFRNATMAVGQSQDKVVDSFRAETILTPDQLELLDGPTSEVLKKLKEVDPAVAEKFHPNDSRRLRRALEIFFTTNQKPSQIYEEQATSQEEGSALALRFKTLVFWIWCEQSTLNARLDSRVDVMLENGLYDEIEELYKDYEATETKEAAGEVEEDESLRKGIYQVIGFKEFLPWLQLTESSPDKDRSGKVIHECIEKMKQRTRKYSKQQTKFMKNTLMPKLNAMVERVPSRTDLAAAVLDATDLSQWRTVVGQAGVQIAKDFFEPAALTPSVRQEGISSDPHFIAATTELRELMVTPKQFTNTQWKHYECDVCVDPSNPAQRFVAVGADQWGIHIKSRKHRNAITGKAKFEHNQRQIALKLKRQREEEEEKGDLTTTEEWQDQK